MTDLTLVEDAAAKLEPLLSDVVFVGGSVLGLLITDPGAEQMRSTVDVDVVAAITTYGEYIQFSERLRRLNFAEDAREGAPLCRWVHGELTLDVMPLEASILGFTNRWYRSALETATDTVLPSGLAIRLITAPVFLATKMEAFIGRGRGDFYGSHDLEDFVSVAEGREELLSELQSAPADLRVYLRLAVRDLLANSHFREALPGYLPSDAASQARLPVLLQRLRQIA